MNRIDGVFAQSRRERRKALIPFITAGFPDPALTLPLMTHLVRAGADILELGVPFSDPMADGPIIQRASEKALAHGVTLTRVLDTVARFRETDLDTPVVLMGYANPIERLGIETFAARAGASGVDGVLTVDYPPEAARDYTRALTGNGIAPIFTVAPTTTDRRLPMLLKNAAGFLYYVALRGVTGATHLDLDRARAQLSALRQCTRLPIGLGFGIHTPGMAAQAALYADAVIVGSRLVREIEQSQPHTMLANASRLIAELRNAMDEATRLQPADV